MSEEMSVEARELLLFAENDSMLYNSSWKPCAENLRKKMRKGIYSSDLALILWRHHADRAAKAYQQEFGTPEDKWYELFSVEDRKAVAKAFRDDFEQEEKNSAEEKT